MTTATNSFIKVGILLVVVVAVLISFFAGDCKKLSDLNHDELMTLLKSEGFEAPTLVKHNINGSQFDVFDDVEDIGMESEERKELRKLRDALKTRCIDISGGGDGGPTPVPDPTPQPSGVPVPTPKPTPVIDACRKLSDLNHDELMALLKSKGVKTSKLEKYKIKIDGSQFDAFDDVEDISTIDTKERKELRKLRDALRTGCIGVLVPVPVPIPVPNPIPVPVPSDGPPTFPELTDGEMKVAKRLAKFTLETFSVSNIPENFNFFDFLQLGPGVLRSTSNAKNAGKSKKNIYVMGVTGAGKSTTIGYLLGCDLVKQQSDDEDEDGEDFVVDYKNACGGMMPKIGHSHGLSTTKGAACYSMPSPNDHVNLCDVAGSLDNQGPAMEVINSLALGIMHKAYPVDALMYIVSPQVFNYKEAKGYHLKELFKSLRSTFSSSQEADSWNSVLIVVNDKEGKITEKKICKSLKHIMTAVSDQMNQKLTLQNAVGGLQSGMQNVANFLKRPFTSLKKEDKEALNTVISKMDSEGAKDFLDFNEFHSFLSELYGKKESCSLDPKRIIISQLSDPDGRDDFKTLMSIPKKRGKLNPMVLFKVVNPEGISMEICFFAIKYFLKTRQEIADIVQDINEVEKEIIMLSDEKEVKKSISTYSEWIKWKESDINIINVKIHELMNNDQLRDFKTVVNKALLDGATRSFYDLIGYSYYFDFNSHIPIVKYDLHSSKGSFDTPEITNNRFTFHVNYVPEWWGFSNSDVKVNLWAKMKDLPETRLQIEELGGQRFRKEAFIAEYKSKIDDLQKSFEDYPKRVLALKEKKTFLEKRLNPKRNEFEKHFKTHIDTVALLIEIYSSWEKHSSWGNEFSAFKNAVKDKSMWDYEKIF